jgi:hypothetical protein
MSETTDHVGDEDATRAGTGWRYHGEAPPEPTAWLIKNVLPQAGAGLISGQWGFLQNHGGARPVGERHDRRAVR